MELTNQCVCLSIQFASLSKYVLVISEVIRDAVPKVLDLTAHLKCVVTQGKSRKHSLFILLASDNHNVALLGIILYVIVNAILGADV